MFLTTQLYSRKTTGVETERDAPLVNACNTALNLLNQVDVPGVKKPTLGILFHRNDPKITKTYHNEVESERKPDIIITSLACAQRRYKEGDTQDAYKEWGDIVQGPPGTPDASSRPDNNFNNFTWLEILSSLELKKNLSDMKKVSRSTEPIDHLGQSNGPSSIQQEPSQSRPKKPDPHSDTIQSACFALSDVYETTHVTKAAIIARLLYQTSP